MDALIDKLNQIKPISVPLKDFLLTNVRMFEFEAGEHLPYRPPASYMIYFVDYGSLAGVNNSENRRDPVILYNKDDFIIPSLHNGCKEYFGQLVFMSPVKLFGIDVRTACGTLSVFPEALDLMFGLIQNHIQKGYQRETFLRLSPRERFSFLFTHKTSLFLESTSAHLAAYLNISKRQLFRYKNSK